jgi:hypothetical protein
MASPSPAPPCRRVMLWSPWRKWPKTKGRKAGAMPSPWSLTVSLVERSPRSRLTSTRPSGWLNFTALESRQDTTCSSRSRSPSTAPAWGSSATWSRIRRASAEWRVDSTAAHTTSARSIGATSSRRLPEVMRDTSSRSSMRRVSATALRSMVSSACFCWSSATRPERIILVHPRMALSGVRSSWFIVLRNSSFTSSASSSAASSWVSFAESAAEADAALRSSWPAMAVARVDAMRSPASSRKPR